MKEAKGSGKLPPPSLNAVNLKQMRLPDSLLSQMQGDRQRPRTRPFDVQLLFIAMNLRKLEVESKSCRVGWSNKGPDMLSLFRS